MGSEPAGGVRGAKFSGSRWELVQPKNLWTYQPGMDSLSMKQVRSSENIFDDIKPTVDDGSLKPNYSECSIVIQYLQSLPDFSSIYMFWTDGITELHAGHIA